MKTVRLILATLALGLMLVPDGFGQVTNDYCTNAITMVSGQIYSANILNATTNGDPRTGWSANLYRGVWYKFVSNDSRQRITVSTCGSDFDTQLAVYVGSCGALTEVAGNDHSNNNGTGGASCSVFGRASVSFSGSNTTYYVLAGATGPVNSGNLQISVDLPPAPTNDICAGAILLTPGLSYTQSVAAATEAGDATSACGNFYRGVWYTLTPPAGARFTISTCDSDYDTVLSVFTNTCGSLSNAICNDNNGPACNSTRASINLADVGGQTYYILASAAGPASAGLLSIIATVQAPQNDLCANPLNLQAGVVTTVNTLNATEAGDPTNCVTGFGRGVWFTYTPSVSGKIGVTTCGSTFDTGLSVYTGVCGSLTNVACSDDGNLNCEGNIASLTFNGVAGTQYRFLAGGKNGAGGDLRILVTAVDLVSASLTAINPAGGLLIAGKNWTVNWIIANQSTNAFSAAWADRLYLSNITTHAVTLLAGGTTNGRSLGPNGNYNYLINNQPMPQVAAGYYLLVGQVDDTDQVAELVETNNVLSLALFVTNAPPTVAMLSPTNHVEQTNCVPMRFKLTASTQPGSYTITNVSYYANGTNLLGQATSAPYAVNSLALPHGVHTITAVVRDNFNLTNISGQDVSIAIRWPTNLHELRVNIATNGDFVGCMCAYDGSNYVVWATTNLGGNPVWQAYVTNLAANGVLSFTNSFTNLIATPQRYFRGQLVP